MALAEHVYYCTIITMPGQRSCVDQINLNALLTPQFWRSYGVPARRPQWYSMHPRDQQRHAEERPACRNIVCTINKSCETSRRYHHNCLEGETSIDNAAEYHLKIHLYLLNSNCCGMAVGSRIDRRWGRHRAYAVAYRTGKPRPSSRYLNNAEASAFKCLSIWPTPADNIQYQSHNHFPLP